VLSAGHSQLKVPAVKCSVALVCKCYSIHICVFQKQKSRLFHIALLMTFLLWVCTKWFRFDM